MIQSSQDASPGPPSLSLMLRLSAVLTTAALCLCAQTTTPDTPAGHAFSAWLEAFNSADRAKVQAYLDRFEPEERDRTPRMLEFGKRTGGFDVVRIENSERLRLDVRLKGRADARFAVAKLEVKDTDPPEVASMVIHLASESDSGGPAGATRLTLDQAVKALESEAASAAANDQFSGAILVTQEGRILLQQAHGLADRKVQVKNTSDTRFRLGSMNKMFTATAVLQMVGGGKLDLDTPIGKYLPDYPNKELAGRVTVRHLLTHTGGTGDIFTPEYEKRRLEIRELADYVKLFGERGLLFPPGSRWEYSNYGYVLLGYLVERVSGVSYYEYVRRRIFEPAGMTATDSLPESDKVGQRSVGYMRRNGSWANNMDTLPWRGTSAGGGYSTVGDLLRFAQALSKGTLLNKELLTAMTSRQAGPAGDTGRGYGFGMGVLDTPDMKRYGHNGGAPGMNGDLRIYPRTGMVVVVLANLDPPAATRLAEFFEARMPLR